MKTDEPSCVGSHRKPGNPLREHINKVSKAQFPSEIPADSEFGDIGGNLKAVEQGSGALIELTTAVTAGKGVITKAGFSVEFSRVG